MANTVTFVTNQYQCDRIICAARTVADMTSSQLVVIEILDAEYELNPQAVDYLFGLSRQNKADMRIMFSDDKLRDMRNAIREDESRHIVTGMPNSNHSVLYDLWKEFPDKIFYTVDTTGEIIEVASNSMIVKA